jgi:hypothetical protein
MIDNLTNFIQIIADVLTHATEKDRNRLERMNILLEEKEGTKIELTFEPRIITDYLHVSKINTSTGITTFVSKGLRDPKTKAALKESKSVEGINTTIKELLKQLNHRS